MDLVECESVTMRASAFETELRLVWALNPDSGAKLLPVRTLAIHKNRMETNMFQITPTHEQRSVDANTCSERYQARSIFGQEKFDAHCRLRQGLPRPEPPVHFSEGQLVVPHAGVDACCCAIEGPKQH